MNAVNPYLYFPGTTEAAFRFYRTVFGGELEIVRFRDVPGNPMDVPDEDLDKVAHAALDLGGAAVLMGTDALASLGHRHQQGDAVAIMLEPDSAAEADELFARLADGGRVALPLGETDWAERHGICTDRFGVPWMLNFAGVKAP